MKVRVEIEKPKRCGECPFYFEDAYQCYNERGTECNCNMGYMKGDFRDQSYRNSLWKGCRLSEYKVK